MAAKADGIPAAHPIPTYPYFYTCVSEVIDCANFLPNQAIQAPPFDSAAQDPNGYYATALAPVFTGNFALTQFVQVSANSSGEAVGYLAPSGVFQGPGTGTVPVLYFDGQVYSPGIPVPAIGPINENGLYLMSGIDGPEAG
jgi:hypothetical protein